MDIYQLSALMAEQRRAERLIQAERRRAAQVASRHSSRQLQPAVPLATSNRVSCPEDGPAAPAGSDRESGRPRVRAWQRLGHALRPRSLSLSKVPSDLR